MPFLYSAARGMVDLNNFLPSGSGWTLNIATGINDAGQITGYGQNAQGDTHAFLLSPAKTRFSTLNAEIEMRGKRKARFAVEGRFTLGTNSNGINPVAEPVTLQLGSFEVTIPPSSFSKTSEGSYIYVGKIDGVALEMNVKPVTADIFEFEARGIGATGLPAKNPVVFTLTVGDDTGTETVKSDLDGEDH